MIKTTADILEAIRAKEVQLLDRQKIRHGPIIGSMYEGLTKSMLEKSLFEGLDLRVSQGFITNPQGVRSKQIDCMLVEGDGEQIPYSDNYIYPIRQVIAVIEVKKSLFAADLSNAYENLHSVVETIDKRVKSDQELRDAWRSITHTEIPTAGEIDQLSIEEEMMLRSLIYEHILPVRIAFGYHGFATEHKLRQAFVEYIEGTAKKGIKQLGFAPHSFPNLILSGDNALVKTNGMPYGGPMREGDWLVYGSLHDRSMLLFLELIWSRISYRFKLGSSMFDDTLQRFASLLWVKYDKDMGGWRYIVDHIAKKTLESGPIETTWEPIEVTEAQFEILNILGKKEFISMAADEDFREFVAVYDIEDVDSFVDNLVQTGLVFLDKDRNLRYLTDQCATAIIPDGRFFAGENKSGEFVRWMNKEIEK